VAGTRTVGSDNPYARWSPIVERPPLAWPNQAGLAIAVIVSVEHLELQPAADAIPSPTAISYGPYPKAFQLTGVSRPEYGARVGAFRLLEVLDRHAIVPAAAIDALRLDERHRLVEEFRDRGAEFLGHGMALSRSLSEKMTEDAERGEIRETLRLLEAATGKRPAGWLGPGYGESTRTVRLLGEQGLRYVCDWPNDEQPYPLESGDRRLVALPVAVDLDDVMVQRIRRLPPVRWARMVIEAAARLRDDGSGGSGRLLVLNLHAHISGQPFRIRHVEEALRTLAGMSGVWITTPAAIVEFYERRLAEAPS
jgi:allantoinase